MKKKRKYGNNGLKKNSEPKLDNPGPGSLEDKESLLSYLKRFWRFLWHDDSLASYVVNFALAFLVIKYIFFPTLGFFLNNDFPIVAIVSGSMEHKIVNGNICGKNFDNLDDRRLNFDEWWGICGDYYEENYDLSKDDFRDFEYQNGLYRGDVMVLYGEDPEDIEIGEVLVFIPGDRAWYQGHGPVIHRVVNKWQDEDGEYHFQTKGDHNMESSSARNFENDIHEDDVIGTTVLRIPLLGYFKLWLSEALGLVGIKF